MILYSVSLAEADECSHRVLEESITDDARREPFRPAAPSVNLVVLAEGQILARLLAGAGTPQASRDSLHSRNARIEVAVSARSPCGYDSVVEGSEKKLLSNLGQAVPSIGASHRSRKKWWPHKVQ